MGLKGDDFVLQFSLGVEHQVNNWQLMGKIDRTYGELGNESIGESISGSDGSLEGSGEDGLERKEAVRLAREDVDVGLGLGDEVGEEGEVVLGVVGRESVSSLGDKGC